LLDFLEGNRKNVLINIELWGFGDTLEDLSGMKPIEENLDKIKEIIENEYSFLKSWLLSFPYYIELGDYIFVHGGVDGKLFDWKTVSSERDFVWNREHELAPVNGKIVIAGHTRVATLRKKTHDYDLLFLHNPEMFDILYKKGKILIDRYVEVSNEINVLKLDI
jgi:serine/threonine protein phosphatase 1